MSENVPTDKEIRNHIDTATEWLVKADQSVTPEDVMRYLGRCADWIPTLCKDIELLMAQRDNLLSRLRI